MSCLWVSSIVDDLGAKPLTGAAQFRATYIIGLRLGCPEDNPYGDSEGRVDGRFCDLLLW